MSNMMPVNCVTCGHRVGWRADGSDQATEAACPYPSECSVIPNDWEFN